MKKVSASDFIMLCLFILLLPLLGYSDEPAYYPDHAWRASTPEEQGLDSTGIHAMLAHISQERLDLHSLLIIRHGYLVAEVYADPYNAATKHPVFSVTKSITATLAGIALDDGHLTSVHQPVLDFFPDIRSKTRDPWLPQLALEHLLTMSAGYQTSTMPDLYGKDASFDAIRNILTYNSILEPPGTVFFYDNGGPHLLSAILQTALGQSLSAYAADRLFAPLGITDVVWEADPQGVDFGNTGLHITPYDLSKIGYLYLKHGRWQDQQLVPTDWIAAATTQHMETAGKMNAAENDGYGYLWWLNGFDGYAAHGYGGQYLFVMPSLDLIVVLTSGLPLADFPRPYELVKTHLLPAVKSDEALPPNPQAVQALEQSIRQLAHPDPLPAAPLPATAQRISGKTFRITRDNSSGQLFTATTLTFTNDQTYTLEILWPNGIRETMTGSLGPAYHLNRSPANPYFHDVALKGYWQDERTFVEQIKEMGRIDTYQQIYTFEGQTLQLEVSSSLGYFAFKAEGEMVE